MSFFLGFILAMSPTSVSGDEQCANPSTDRDVEICKYLERVDKLKIRSVDSVAVGTSDQMLSIRPQARKCGLTNRIDYVGSKIGVFDIINATKAQRDCVVSWINANVPDLKFSEQKLDKLLQQNLFPKEK